MSAGIDGLRRDRGISSSERYQVHTFELLKNVGMNRSIARDDAETLLVKKRYSYLPAVS